MYEIRAHPLIAVERVGPCRSGVAIFGIIRTRSDPNSHGEKMNFDLSVIRV